MPFLQRSQPGATGAVPLRTPFFYGWVIVAMAMVAGFLATGSSQIVTGIMVRPMTSDHGWNLTLTSGAFTLGSLLAGLLSPGFGALSDRFGARWLFPIGAAIYAAAMLSITAVDELWLFYVCYVTARLASVGCLSGVASMTAVTNWFSARRGRAAGLITLSTPIGNSFWASFGQFLVGVSGWRSTYAVMAATMGSLVILPGLFLMRRRPEDVGLQPDGGDPVRMGGTRPTTKRVRQESYTLPQALRTKALWLLAFGQLVGVSAWATVAFHTPSFVTTLGLSPVTGAAAISAASLAGAVSSGAWGLLSERYSERNLTIIVGIGSALFLRLMSFPQSDLTIVAASFIYGLTARGESALYSLLLAGYFGRESFGKISGFIAPFTLVGVAIGPLLGSLVFDLTGTYQGLYLALSGVHLVGALLVFFARDPGPPETKTPQMNRISADSGGVG
ncbi:MAG: MFS transporter [Chloroflexota bacterium]